MLTIEQTKELLGEPNMSDTEAGQMRQRSYKLADLFIDRWLADKSRLKNIENKNEDKQTQQIL